MKRTNTRSTQTLNNSDKEIR